MIDSNGSQRGRAIGGHNNGSYTVSDCYYLEGCDDDPASNGWYTGTALSCVVSVTAMPKADMRSQKLVDALNCNGAAYAAVQGSYPVLAWEAERSPAAHTVRITQPEGGTIAADAGETVVFGTVLHLSNTPDIGWAFRTYTLNGETLTGPYATITADAAVSGVFSRMTAGALYIENDPAFTITVKKDGTVMENGTARRVTDYPVADGDPLYEGDVLTGGRRRAGGSELCLQREIPLLFHLPGCGPDGEKHGHREIHRHEPDHERLTAPARHGLHDAQGLDAAGRDGLVYAVGRQLYPDVRAAAGGPGPAGQAGQFLRGQDRPARREYLAGKR